MEREHARDMCEMGAGGAAGAAGNGMVAAYAPQSPSPSPSLSLLDGGESGSQRGIEMRDSISRGGGSRGGSAGGDLGEHGVGEGMGEGGGEGGAVEGGVIGMEMGVAMHAGDAGVQASSGSASSASSASRVVPTQSTKGVSFYQGEGEAGEGGGTLPGGGLLMSSAMSQSLSSESSMASSVSSSSPMGNNPLFAFSMHFSHYAIRFSIARQIAQGMRFLHSRRIVHRDLKPDNCLFDRELTVKLCDFGMSRLQDNKSKVLMTGEVGTPAYMAVELARGDSKSYDSSVDVFSFGVLLWALWTGSEPYSDMSINNAFHLMDQVCAGMRPKVPQSMPQGLQELMETCWHADPRKRPSFDEVVKMLGALERELDVDSDVMHDDDSEGDIDVGGGSMDDMDLGVDDGGGENKDDDYAHARRPSGGAAVVPTMSFGT